MNKLELKELIRETVKEVIDEENPIYKDLADVPEYWKCQVASLLCGDRQRRDISRMAGGNTLSGPTCFNVSLRRKMKQVSGQDF